MTIIYIFHKHTDFMGKNQNVLVKNYLNDDKQNKNNVWPTNIVTSKTKRSQMLIFQRQSTYSNN